MRAEQRLKHLLNPLHLYCRMRDVHVPQHIAKKICVFYDKIYHLFTRRIY